MGFKDRLRRLERELERDNAPTFADFSVAAVRQTARNLAGAYRKLAAHGGNPSGERTRGPEGDTPEQAESDRRTIERWEGPHGKADLSAYAEEARARLLGGGRGY